MENLKVKDRVWGNEYYYVKVVHDIVEYHEIYYKTKTEKKLLTDYYPTFNGL